MPAFAQPVAPNFTLQIAAGVALGILSAIAIVWAYTSWRAQLALDELAARSEQFARAADEQARRQAAAVRAQAVADEQEQVRRTGEIAEQQRAAEAASQSQLATAAAREAAWRRFYQQPARCIDNPSSETLVQCANEFIRAKRAFDAGYKPG